MGIHNTVCNDLLKLRYQHAELPDLDLVSYFLICRKEIDQWLLPDDPIYAEKLTAWAEALAKQPQEIINAVQTRLPRPPEHEEPVWYREVWRLFYNSSIARNTRKRFAKQEVPVPQFENILQATSWIEDRRA
jgi:hypothetical protein